MKTKPQISPVTNRNILFPDVLVKTRYGNVHLKSLINNKRIIIYTNPFELIPKNSEGRFQFENALKKLKKLNYHLIGFNKNSFDEHLRSINWINSYLDESLVFPVFYQPKNEVKKHLEESLSKKIMVENPIYFIDQIGNTQTILNGDNVKNKCLDKVVEVASKMVLSDQKFGNGPIFLDN